MIREKKMKKISVILTDDESEMLKRIMRANKMTVSSAVKLAIKKASGEKSVIDHIKDLKSMIRSMQN